MSNIEMPSLSFFYLKTALSNDFVKCICVPYYSCRPGVLMCVCDTQLKNCGAGCKVVASYGANEGGVCDPAELGLTR